MKRKVYAALDEAAGQTRSEIETAGLAMSPPAYDFFAALVHQHMYCTMCGADPTTFAGGRAEAAMAVIRNSQRIAKHYWGAQIEASS